MALAFALVLAFPLASYATLGDSTRISVAVDGTQGNNGYDDLANSRIMLMEIPMDMLVYSVITRRLYKLLVSQ